MTITTKPDIRLAALRARLEQLAPLTAATLHEPSVRRVERALALAMEHNEWQCPCGDGPLTVESNVAAPFPDPPVTIHNDEGAPVASCACGQPLELWTLVPVLVWHVAQAGVFGVVRDDGTFIAADDYEADGGRYIAASDPAHATAAAVRAMNRYPDDLIQVIPEAKPR